MIPLSDPAVRSIALQKSHEGFVDLAGFHDRIAVDLDRRDIESRSPHFLKVRRGVAERLIAAAHALPAGLRLYVKEGYRPLALQRRYFTEHLAHLRRTLNPLPDEDTLVALTSHYVAPPEVAAHPTGAAIDLTLISAEGIEIDMGTIMNATDQESSGACYTHNTFISRAKPPDPDRRADPRRLHELPVRMVALVVRRPLLGRHAERIARNLRSCRGKHARRSIAMTVFPIRQT